MKYNHLTLDERNLIQQLLSEHDSVPKIAKRLKRSPSTIRNEIRNNSSSQKKNSFNSSNFKNSNDCRKRNTSPFICNGCPEYKYCRKSKRTYKASYAQLLYENRLSQSREGLNLTDDEYDYLISAIVPRLKMGQSPYHIAASTDNLPCSIQTMYRHITNGVLPITKLDMPRKKEYKARGQSKTVSLKKRKLRKPKRTYKDFLKYVDENPEVPIAEMDTVEGSGSNHVILTVIFRLSHFMLMFLMPNQRAESTVEVFDMLENKIGTDTFRRLFPIILTDNGSEFADTESLERSCLDDSNRTTVFYCEPQRSDQKGTIEKNHQFIRYVLRKNDDFSKLTQEDITLLSNQINSYIRKLLNKKSPFEVLKFLEGDSGHDWLDQLNLSQIQPEHVQLNRHLLFHKNK